jgi:hypothetical protein
MYDNELGQRSDLFDLYSGQMRGGSGKLTHNSGWYNKSGEKLGWGDLSVSDMKRIAKEIGNDELFIVLSEGNSHWNFVGCTATVDLDEHAPGAQYVAEKAMYIIGRRKYYYVERFLTVEKEAKTVSGGLTFDVLTPEEATEIAMEGTTKNH